MDARRVNTTYRNGGNLVMELFKNNRVSENYEIYVHEKDVSIKERENEICVSVRVYNIDIFRNVTLDTTPDRIDLRITDTIVFTTTQGKLPKDFELQIFVIPFTEVYLDIYYPSSSYQISKSTILDMLGTEEIVVNGIYVVGSLLNNPDRERVFEDVKKCKDNDVPFFHIFHYDTVTYAILYSAVNLGVISVVKLGDMDNLLAYREITKRFSFQ
jgi:hypothetical protein